MTESTVQLLRRGLDLLNDGFARRRDLRSVVDSIAGPEVELETPSDLPEAGPFLGRDQMAGFLEAFRDTWDECGVEIDEVIAESPDRAVVRLRLWGRGSGSGIETEGFLIAACFLREGRLARMVLGRDRDAALATVGLTG
jgi:hypothetical protein